MKVEAEVEAVRPVLLAQLRTYTGSTAAQAPLLYSALLQALQHNTTTYYSSAQNAALSAVVVGPGQSP
eukprot:COSAG02_NODE_10610_length_1901_cov_0.897891_2_plen_68_part_00